MAFTAQFDGGKCPKCDGMIYKRDRIRFNAADQVEHAECSGDLNSPEGNIQIWSVTAESLDRAEREDLEMARIAPIGRQGTCPKCFLELPATRICGYC